jgi:hypothetical protein
MDEEKLEQLQNTAEEGNSHEPDTDPELENLCVELKVAIDELKSMLITFYLKKNKETGHEWLTSSEAQKLLRISRTTLKRYRVKSNMRRVELSKRRFLYHIEDVRKISYNDFE